jgi:hypothetical protein
MKISRFTKFGIIFTVAHFIVTLLFVFVALIWWGHGGNGAPSPFVKKFFTTALQVWTLGDLPCFLSSPIYGFALSLGFVILTWKRGEKLSL